MLGGKAFELVSMGDAGKVSGEGHTPASKGDGDGNSPPTGLSLVGVGEAVGQLATKSQRDSRKSQSSRKGRG